VDLVEVDVLHAQAGEGGVDAGQDVLAGEPATVLARGHRHADLGGHDELVTGEEPGEQATGGHLRRATRVDVGGVEERDAALDRGAHDRLGGVLVEDPGAVRVVAEAHHAEADPRDAQAGATEVDVLHVTSRDRGVDPSPP